MEPKEVTEQTVLDADEARYQALYALDCDALSAMLDESYAHTHATGKIDTKEEFLASIRSAKYRFINASRSQQRVRHFSNVWILDGVTRTTISVGDQEKTMNNAFVTVWKQEQGALKMVHWQATALPAA